MVMESQHGSRADSETAQDVFGLLVRYGKQAVQSMIDRDLVRLLVERNFGREALRLAPCSSLNKTEHQDFAANATAVSALYKDGYLVPSQLKDTDAMLGLTIRTEEAANKPPVIPGAAPDTKNGQSTADKPGKPENGDRATKEVAGDKPATFLAESPSVMDRLVAAFANAGRWITVKGRRIFLSADKAQHFTVAASLSEYLADRKLGLPKPRDFEPAALEITRAHNRNEGCTFSLYWGDLKDTPGYSVAVHPTRKEDFVQGPAVSQAAIRMFIEAHKDRLLNPRYAVGTWYNVRAVKEDRKSFLDTPITVPDRRDAVELGKKRNQIGIFDLETKKYIRTGGAGTDDPEDFPEAQALPPASMNRLGRKGY